VRMHSLSRQDNCAVLSFWKLVRTVNSTFYLKLSVFKCINVIFASVVNVSQP